MEHFSSDWKPDVNSKEFPPSPPHTHIASLMMGYELEKYFHVKFKFLRVEKIVLGLGLIPRYT